MKITQNLSRYSRAEIEKEINDYFQIFEERCQKSWLLAIEQAILITPNPYYFYEKAIIHFKNGQPNKAQISVQKAITEMAERIASGNTILKDVYLAKSSYSRFLSLQARIMHQQGNITKAEEIFHQAIQAYPLQAATRFQFGLFYKTQQKYQQAERLLWESYYSSPDSFLPILEIAEIYLLQGNHEKAISLIRNYYNIKYSYQTGAENWKKSKVLKNLRVLPWVAETFFAQKSRKK